MERKLPEIETRLIYGELVLMAESAIGSMCKVLMLADLPQDFPLQTILDAETLSTMPILPPTLSSIRK